MTLELDHIGLCQTPSTPHGFFAGRLRQPELCPQAAYRGRNLCSSVSESIGGRVLLPVGDQIVTIQIKDGRQDDVVMRQPSSSIEFDKVLKDQLTPAISARLDQQPTFGNASKFDRRETDIFRERANVSCSIATREKHDSPATMYGRILVKDCGRQMVEPFDQSSTSEGHAPWPWKKTALLDSREARRRHCEPPRI